jgi:hypothetical protein
MPESWDLLQIQNPVHGLGAFPRQAKKENRRIGRDPPDRRLHGGMEQQHWQKKRSFQLQRQFLNRLFRNLCQDEEGDEDQAEHDQQKQDTALIEKIQPFVPDHDP